MSFLPVTVDVDAFLEGHSIALDGPVDGHSAPRGNSELPQSLGRLAVEGELGRGGMGQVLDATDPSLGRRVAVKVVLDPQGLSRQQLLRFVSEAQITAQLEHPAIIPVHEMGCTEEGKPYFIMSRITGRDLGEVLAFEHRLAAGEDSARSRHRLLTAFLQVCRAVAYANSRGVVHRDLKPSNIMLGEYGAVFVLDWGVARVPGNGPEPVQRVPWKGGELAATLDGQVIGTPGYMSPEQVEGVPEAIDARSDVWSLGAVLYELLSLQPAYDGGSLEQALILSLLGPPPAPSDRAPARAIPPELDEVCLKALATRPDERYADAGELAEAIEAVLEGSRRRQRAAEHLVVARTAWARYGALQSEGAKLRVRLGNLEQEVKSWQTLEEKADLLAVRARLAELGDELVDVFEEVLAACELAMSTDPDGNDASALLAEVHYGRLLEAERDGDVVAQRRHTRITLRHDDGTWAPRVEGKGALTLRTDPPGATVLCQQVKQRGLIWSLDEERFLGTTPLERQPLGRGSYVLTLRLPGKRDTTYPVCLGRGEHWHSGEAAVPLLTEEQIGAGFRYVPAGPTQLGGDPNAFSPSPARRVEVPGFFIAERPVTVGDWREFLNHLQATGETERAWVLVPRQGGLAGRGNQMWPRPGPEERYAPQESEFGDVPWNVNWPLFGISWADADAYVQWRLAADGLAFQLPPNDWWEKAGRGVDGRFYPWGERYDPCLCKSPANRQGWAQPEPVGTFPHDRSVYGIQALAGGPSEWIAGERNSSQRVARGGSFSGYAEGSRLAGRQMLGARSGGFVGFRLARPLRDL